MTRPDPLSRVKFRGKLMDRKTAAALAVAEQRLGYQLTVVQGCYNPGGVAASAGTHDRGGVVDLAPYDAATKVKVLREIGFAAWARPKIEGLWGAHVHAVLVGHQDLSEAAERQTTAYQLGYDGLAGNHADPNHYHPNVPDFSYAKYWHDELLVQRILGLKAKRRQLADQISAAKAKLTYTKAP